MNEFDWDVIIGTIRQLSLDQQMRCIMTLAHSPMHRTTLMTSAAFIDWCVAEHIHFLSPFYDVDVKPILDELENAFGANKE